MREEIRQKIWIVTFFLLICGVHLFWLAVRNRIDLENYENRASVERPVFSFDKIEEFPAEYEAYYNDHLPFRNGLMRLNSEIEYYIFQNSSNPNVIKGKDGWLFYNSSVDDNPMETYKGLNLFTEEELVKIKDNLLHSKSVLEGKGIEFVLFIAPNKERIYMEKMPDYYGPPAECYRTKQLIAYLEENTDIRIVYPYEDLWKAKENREELLYYRLDTHWNYMGGYIGSYALAEELGISMVPLEELTVAETEPTICDLADMLNMRKKLNTDRDFVLSGYDRYHVTTEKHDLIGEYIYHCQGADPRKLFMLRDSFADAMDDFIAAQFDESYMVHYKSFSQELIDEQQPDIFVYETVERRIGELLKFRIE